MKKHRIIRPTPLGWFRKFVNECGEFDNSKNKNKHDDFVFGVDEIECLCNSNNQQDKD
jgi:hypothetical protein